MSTYNFYMQKVVWDSETNSYIAADGEAVYDLEANFKGLKYVKCVGLNEIGEHIVYQEEYADDNRKRVYIPENPVHKSTQIKLTLLFVGNDRQQVFNAFNDYIMDGFHAYWDTARRKKIVFYVSSPIKLAQDEYRGGTPYIENTYTLNNVYGKAFNVEEVTE